MKKCSSCLQEKSIDEFHNRAKAKDGKQARCIDCNKSQRVAYYKTANGKSKNDQTGKRYFWTNKRRVYDYLLTQSCIDCGNDNPIVLDFDHRDPSKKRFTIGSKQCMDQSWSTIENEIDKCDIRCANCHRIRTAKQFGNSRMNWYNESRSHS